MLTRCLTLAVAVASTTIAFAGTPQDAYNKLWSKRAIDGNDSTTWEKPKAMCVCNDGTSNARRPGALGVGNAGGVAFCALPTFDAEGNVVTIVACYTFEYVGK